MIVIITGKTGVGKTTILKKYNYKNTIFIDEYIKESLYKKGQVLYEFIKNKFGEKYVNDLGVDIPKFSYLFFNDKNARSIIETEVNFYIKKYLSTLNKEELYLVEMATYINFYKYFKDVVNYTILLKRKKISLKNKSEILQNNVDKLVFKDETLCDKIIWNKFIFFSKFKLNKIVIQLKKST